MHGRRERLLLAEEAAFLAFGTGDSPVATGDAAQALLDAPAAGDLAPAARDRLHRPGPRPPAGAPRRPDRRLRARARRGARRGPRPRCAPPAPARRASPSSRCCRPTSSASSSCCRRPTDHGAPTRTDLSAFAALDARRQPDRPGDAGAASPAATPTTQTEADYAIPQGLTLRDEIARYFRIGQAYFDRFAQGRRPHRRPPRLASSRACCTDAFGFADLAAGDAPRRPSPPARGRVPVVVVPPADALDRASAALAGDGRRRSAASALQDWLNAERRRPLGPRHQRRRACA